MDPKNQNLAEAGLRLHDAGNVLTIIAGRVRRLSKAADPGLAANEFCAAVVADIARLAGVLQAAKLAVGRCEDELELGSPGAKAPVATEERAKDEGEASSFTVSSRPSHQQRTRQLFEIMQDGLVVIDASAAIIEHNPAACAILGLTQEELLGRSALDPRWKTMRADGTLLQGEEYPAIVALVSGKVVVRSLMGVKRPAGDTCWIRINATPFEADRPADRPLPGVPATRRVIVTFADITDLVVAKAQLDDYFSTSSDLICIAGSQGCLKRVNPAFTRILGYTQEEMRGRHALRLVHSADRSAVLAALATLDGDSHQTTLELRLRSKSGTYRTISWQLQRNPRSGQLHASGRDVTEDRHAEESLRRLMAALNESAIVVTTDHKGRITQVNDNFCKISGYAPEELLGHTHRMVNSGEHPREFFAEMWRTITQGKTWTGDIKNRRKDGTFYWVRTVISPIQSAEGGVPSYIAIRFDITHQKSVEQLNQKISEELKEAQSIAKVGSWSLDLTSKKMIWSSEEYKIFELDESLVGEELCRGFRSRIHPEDLEKIDRLIERSHWSDESSHFEHRVVCRDGRIKHVQVISRVTRDAGGRPLRISGTSQDVTDHVQRDEQTRFILDALGIGVWKLNLVTKELLWDKIMFQIYDVAEQNFSGDYSAWESKLTPTERARAVEELEAAIRGDKEFNTTFEIMTAGHGTRHVAARGKVLRNSQGKPTFMYGVNYDCTHEVLAEQALELERVKSVRNAKLASLGEMSAGIAHEINNPLAVIDGTVRSLQKFINEPEAFNARVETIKKASDRIVKIVRSLKKFSRSSEKSEHDYHPISKILEEAVTLTGAKSKRLSVTVEVSLRTAAWVRCDEIEIEQVLVNLINNGIYAVKSLDERWLRLEVCEEAGAVVVQVWDSGKGISPDVQKRLFQPFFTTKPAGEGTGLGLSIVKGILDEHGATIELLPSVGHTCFEIRFPPNLVMKHVS